MVAQGQVIRQYTKTSSRVAGLDVDGRELLYVLSDVGCYEVLYGVELLYRLVLRVYHVYRP